MKYMSEIKELNNLTKEAANTFNKIRNKNENKIEMIVKKTKAYKKLKEKCNTKTNHRCSVIACFESVYVFIYCEPLRNPPNRIEISEDGISTIHLLSVDKDIIKYLKEWAQDFYKDFFCN